MPDRSRYAAEEGKEKLEVLAEEKASTRSGKEDEVAAEAKTTVEERETKDLSNAEKLVKVSNAAKAEVFEQSDKVTKLENREKSLGHDKVVKGGSQIVKGKLGSS